VAPTPTVTFSVTDPTNNDEPYDLATTSSLIDNLRFTVAWTTDEYTNKDAGNNEGQPDRTNLYSSGTLNATAGPNPGEYMLDLSDVPGTITSGSGTVTLEGHPVDSTLGTLPVTSAAKFFSIDGQDIVPRRDVVDINKCDNCHQQLTLHGDNRVDNINVCVTCHNPNATDRGQRPADASTTSDGKTEQAIDFKFMIHAIHAANIVVYGFGNREHDFTDVAFPEPQLQNCAACHEEDTYYPVDTTAVLGTTISSGADRTIATDNIRISPTTAVCSACHVPEAERDNTNSTNAAKLHMQQNGGDFSLADGDPVNETCSLCHGPGRLADIEKVHDFN
jgi:OmcA/MtrC family decaheme c-type cytochrome